MPSFINFASPGTPNLADYTSFLNGIITSPEVPNPATVLLATDPTIQTTLSLAQEIVEDTVLPSVAPMTYTLAVYHLGADRLITFIQDLADQTYFEDLRRRYRIFDPSFGVNPSVSDGGTSVGIANPEQMKLLTLAELQYLKTPFGRFYMSFAQKFGTTAFGFS